jgi:hypothetical protein
MARMNFTKRSELTGIEYTIELPYSEIEFYRRYIDWRSGMLIQDAFPGLDNSLREFIKTGVAPTEWEELLGNDDD